MANEVKIKVTADQKGAKLDVPREELAKLRGETKAMQEAVAKLAAARERQEAAAHKAQTAEEKLARTLAESRGVTARSVEAQTERTNELRAAAAAARAAADAEEKLKKTRHEEQEPRQDTEKAPSLDFSKSFLNKDQLLGEAKSYGIQAGAVLAGALGAGISTVAAAGLFVGIAAAAQSSNEGVAAAYSNLWNQVKTGAQEASASLGTDFVQGAEKLGRTFNALKPQLTEAFTAAGPVVGDLFDGIDRGVRAVMPGLVTATKAAKDATGGLADMMESAGRGVSNFFTESSAGARAGGEAFQSFGLVVERLGSFAGRILADLANNSGNVFPQLVQMVDAGATAVENFAHVALPSIASGAGLALGGVTLLFQLANTLINTLGPAAPVISTFASSLKLIDMVSFGQVGKSWDSFKTSIGDAEGFAGKAKAGFGALVSSGLGPLAVAAGVAGVVLNGLSEEQQKAAQEAQQHQQRIQSLTQALLANGGAIDSNIRALAVKALSEKQVDGKSVIDAAKESGVALDRLTDAYMGNADAQAEVNKQLDDFQLQHSNVDAGMDSLGFAAKDLQDVLPGLFEEFKIGAQHAKDMGAAMGGSAAASKAQAQALQEVHDQIMALVNKDFAYRQSVEATTKAQKDATEALKTHGATSSEYRGAVEGVESAQARQAQAAYDLAYSNSVATTEIGKTRDATFGYNQEVLRLAEGAGDIATRSLGLMISRLSDTDLSAQGASRSINAAGQEVIKLPNGKTITVNADDRASAAITSIAGRSYTAVVKLVGQWAGYYGLPNGVVLSGSSAHGNAAGGPVAHAAEGGARTGPTLVNERGRQEAFTSPGGSTFLLPMGGQVMPNANVQAMADQQAFRRRDGGGEVAVQWIGGPTDDLGAAIWEYLKRNVRIVGGGSVQSALGQGGQAAA